MSVDWSYFDKFESLDSTYLPSFGEGDTKATQIVTAVCKLVYKWYNDGDVFDNTCNLTGWCNNLSSYANWLDQNTEKAGKILEKIFTIEFDCESKYEDLLKELSDALMDDKYLAEQHKLEKVGSVYNREGRFRFEEDSIEDDDDDSYDDEDF